MNDDHGISDEERVRAETPADRTTPAAATGRAFATVACTRRTDAAIIDALRDARAPGRVVCGGERAAGARRA